MSKHQSYTASSYMSDTQQSHTFQSSARFGNTQGTQYSRGMIDQDGHARQSYMQSTNPQGNQNNHSLPPPSPAYIENDCNLIVWGQWKEIYDSPIQLNFLVDTPEGLQPIKSLNQCVVEMICVHDACLFITEDGTLYSMGQSIKGLLGLGRVTVTTNSHAMRVHLPLLENEQFHPQDDEIRVNDIKAGNAHVLALTTEGLVYSWGMNQHGQVGSLSQESQQQQDSNIFWTPQLIYPTPDILQALNNDTSSQEFDRAIQILAYEDSSFILTESGKLLSFGKNEHNFLGRETKIDLKSQQQQQDSSRIRFNNCVPMVVRKLERYRITRIQVKDGRFMCFFADDLSQNTIGESIDENHQKQSKHSTQSVSGELAAGSSEFDSEEEKDIVDKEFLSRGVLPKTHKLQSHSLVSSRSSSSSAGGTSVTSSSGASSSSQTSVRSSRSHLKKYTGTRGSSRVDKDTQRRYETITHTLRQACEIRDKLQRFERMLADSMKPLLDCESRGLYSDVLDKFIQGTYTSNEAEELRVAVDKIQVQFKANLALLQGFEQDITAQVRDYLREQQDLQKKLPTYSIHDEALFSQLHVLPDLLGESLSLKKYTLVGCKMKVYQERLKELNFLELLTHYMQDKNDDNLQIFDQQAMEGLLRQTRVLARKTQQSIKKAQEHYLQVHMGMSVPASLGLSTMTGGTYQLCDLWAGINRTTMYTVSLLGKVGEAQQGNERIRALWQVFQQLQETDFDKKVEKYQQIYQEQQTHAVFDTIMREVHAELKQVIGTVRAQIKENSRRGEHQDVLFFFQTLILDAALTRQILFSTQQALFESTSMQHNDVSKEQQPIEESSSEHRQTPGGAGRASNASSVKGQTPDAIRKRGPASVATSSKKSSHQNDRSERGSTSAKQQQKAPLAFTVRETPDQQEEAVTPQPAGAGGLIGGFLSGLFSSAKK